LLPEELHHVAAVVPRRRREFTAGRNCARAALRALGVQAGAIGVGTRRAPQFPEGISGTITHTDGYCAASVIRRGVVLSIGIDAECNAALEEGVAALVLRDDERAWLRRLPDAGASHWSTLVFSAKEAFYKAYFQLCQIELEFADASVELDPGRMSFSLRLWRRDLPDYFRQRRFEGRFSVDSGHVYTAIALPHPDYGGAPAVRGQPFSGTGA
jgi:4'-phosphopantetheinyl transferase EntD